MSPHTMSFRAWHRTSPLLQMRLWHLGVLVALVAIAIADIQDHRGQGTCLDPSGLGGIRGVRAELLAVLAWRAGSRAAWARCCSRPFTRWRWVACSLRPPSRTC